MSWQLLSEASSRQGDMQRWFEVELYSRLVGSDAALRPEYKVVMSGMSLIRGETDRVRTEVTTSPHAVVDFLAMGEPGRRYVPKVSRKALHEAGDIDQALADALDDFDTVVTR